MVAVENAPHPVGGVDGRRGRRAVDRYQINQEFRWIRLWRAHIHKFLEIRYYVTSRAHVGHPPLRQQ